MKWLRPHVSHYHVRNDSKDGRTHRWTKNLLVVGAVLCKLRGFGAKRQQMNNILHRQRSSLSQGSIFSESSSATLTARSTGILVKSWWNPQIRRNFWQCNQYSQQQATKFSQDNQNYAITYRVLLNPSREFWIATTLKLLKNLFRLWGIFSPNLRILSRKNNEPTPFILFLAMTVTTNTSDRPNASLVHG